MRILRIHYVVLFLCVPCVRAHAGYTHYFTWHQRPDESALKSCVSEMREIIGARTNILVGPNGPGTMIVDSTNVDLNGIGDDAHEPFVFPGELGFNFCKTEGKPYDAVVTACLLVCRDHFPSSVLSIDSDGSWPNDWQDGIKLYSSVLGRTPPNPMSPLWRVVGWRSSFYVYVPAAILLIIVIWFLWKMREKY